MSKWKARRGILYVQVEGHNKGHCLCPSGRQEGVLSMLKWKAIIRGIVYVQVEGKKGYCICTGGRP